MSTVGRLVAGSISGAVATAPMTAAMAAMHRRLPWHERDPLPPRQITDELAERAGVADEFDESDRQSATLASHFGYGAGTGALYGLIGPRLPVPRIASGVLFALTVWTVSYLGWLPAMRILPPAYDEPARRNALMIVAHVVWGAAMGLVLAFLDRRRRN